MTIISASAGAELFVAGAAGDCVDNVTPLNTPTNVVTRTAFSVGGGDYCYDATLDDQSDTGLLRIVRRDGGATNIHVPGGSTGYACFPVYLMTGAGGLVDANIPDVPVIFLQINGSTFYNGLCFCWQKNGSNTDITFRTALATTQTASSVNPPLDTVLWVKFFWDDTNGIVKLWLGQDDGTGRLTDETDWDAGNEVFSRTDATQNGSFSFLNFGAGTFSKTDANARYRWGEIVYSDADMDQPWLVSVPALPNGEGTDSSGTTWDDQSGNAATFDEVDDPVNAADDGTTTMIVTNPDGTTNTRRYSATMEAFSATGVGASDTIGGVLAIWHFAKSASGSNSNVWGYLGDGSNRDDAASSFKWAQSGTTWSPSWYFYTTAPDGSAWTSTLFDGVEQGVAFTDVLAAGTDIWRVTAMYLLVVYQVAAPAAGTRRVFVIS